MHPYQERIERALEMEGGLYRFEDIVASMADGHFQSFSIGDSLLITKIVEYPRKKVLELVLMVGTAEELHSLESQIIEFAEEQSCDALFGAGRLGWEGFMTDGWRKAYSVYVKELGK